MQVVPQAGVPQGYTPITGVSVMAIPQQAIMVPFVPYVSDGFTGTDKAIQTVTLDAVRIIYRASFHQGICCATGLPRRYLYVLENGYEQNRPWAECCCCRGTFCNVVHDSISRTYFDRGVFDQRGLCRYCKCIRGAPSTYGGEVKYVCCCFNCCECYNQLMACYCAPMLGERVRLLPCEAFCCCIPTRSFWLINCCSLCGPKDGEPLCLCPFADCLKGGSSESLALAFKASREAWKQRTGLP